MKHNATFNVERGERAESQEGGNNVKKGRLAGAHEHKE